jgi:hypothetical protein
MGMAASGIVSNFPKNVVGARQANWVVAAFVLLTTLFQ